MRNGFASSTRTLQFFQPTMHPSDTTKMTSLYHFILYMLINGSLRSLSSSVMITTMSTRMVSTHEVACIAGGMRGGHGIRVRVLYCLPVMFMRRSREKSGYNSIPSRLRRSRKSSGAFRQLPRLTMAVFILEDLKDVLDDLDVLYKYRI